MMQYQDENIIPLGYAHYLVESWTEPGEWHAVDLEAGECSCIGFQCTQYCRHLDVMKEFEECLKRSREISANARRAEISSSPPTATTS